MKKLKVKNKTPKTEKVPIKKRFEMEIKSHAEAPDWTASCMARDKYEAAGIFYNKLHGEYPLKEIIKNLE